MKSGKYKVPKEIRDKAPKGTYVVRRKDKFYLYTNKMKRVTEGKSVLDEKRKLIAKYIDGEFVLRRDIALFSEIEQRDYGSHAIALACSTNLRSDLKTCFPEYADQLCFLASIALVGGCRDVTDIKSRWGTCIFSVQHPEINSDSFATILSGTTAVQQDSILSFEREMVSHSSKKIALRCHKLFKSEGTADLAINGTATDFLNKAFPPDREMVVMACDAETGMPLMAEIRRDPDLGTFQSAILKHLSKVFGSMTGMTFIALDDEFYNKDIIRLLCFNGNHFILMMPTDRFSALSSNGQPVKEGNISLGWQELDLRTAEKCFLFEKGDYEEKPLNKEETMGMTIGKEFLKYTVSFALRTNGSCTPLQLCNEFALALKTVESYRYFKDIIGDKSSMYPQYMRSFVFLISSILRKQLVDTANSLHSSFDAVLEELGMIKIQKAFGKWVMVNLTNDRLKSLKEFHVDPAADLETLNGPLWKKE